MKSFPLIIFVLLVALFQSSSSSDDYITMRYQMTQCADPWMTDGDYFDAKEATLLAFLKEKGIDPVSVKVITNCPDAAVCTACICLGCDLAEVKIDAADEAALKALGFIRI